MGLPVNFSKDDVPAGQALPAGSYEVEVVKAVPKEVGEDGKHAGETYLRLELRPLDENLSSERFFSNLNFWPESKRFLMRDLLALGYTEDQLRDPKFSVEEEDLVGRKATARIGVETYEGEERNKVRALNPIGSVAGGSLPT